MRLRRPTHRTTVVAGVILAMALTACGGDSDPAATEDTGTEDTAESASPTATATPDGTEAPTETGSATATEAGVIDEPVELSLLVDNTETVLALFEAYASAFTEQQPSVTINIETRPQGGEGDNVVKTRLSTQSMTDMFAYNSGSLFQALNPTETITPITSEVAGALNDAFVQAVSADGNVYGVPYDTAMGGGVLYNTAAYDDLGLEVPLTWDEFMANNEAIASESEAAPVIQTYQDTWTSQLFVLGDFHNVQAAHPDWAEQFTANEVKFATTPEALAGFQHLQAVNEAGYLNEDYASATYADGLNMLANGEGVHYPMLTFAIPEIAALSPDALDDIGFFALPGDDAATNGLTVWTPAAVYVPTTTEGIKLEAAQAFQAFLASPEGCAVHAGAVEVGGPYVVEGCELPADVPQPVSDMLPYFQEEGATTPALEFLSPVKGPALEQITVEVGSGLRSAEDGAALYDEDVEKQAQQLGLEGWG